MGTRSPFTRRRLAVSAATAAALVPLAAVAPLPAPGAHAADVTATCTDDAQPPVSEVTRTVPFTPTGPVEATAGESITIVLQPSQLTWPANYVEGTPVETYANAMIGGTVTGGTVTATALTGGDVTGDPVTAPFTADGFQLVMPGPFPTEGVDQTFTLPEVELTVTAGESGEIVVAPASPILSFDMTPATEEAPVVPISCVADDATASTLTVPIAEAPVESSEYVGVTPGRILDTRDGAPTVDGLFEGSGPSGPGATIELQVAGRAGVPEDASAAALNITMTDTVAAGGYLTVWPCGEPQPNASSLNSSVEGDSRANLVLSKLGEEGTVCIYTAEAATHVLADVNGYFPAASSYTPINPARVLDTRPDAPTIDGENQDGPIVAGTTVELDIAGRADVPADAAAVAINITATDTEGWGFVTVYPCGEEPPGSSSVNFTDAGQTSPNTVISKLGEDGKLCLYTEGADTQLIVDVNGYFPAGSPYTSINPERLLDTREGSTTVDGEHAGTDTTGVGTTIELPVAGRGTVPADATAVVLNVTATGTEGWGWVTVWSCDGERPEASNVNYTEADQTRPNAVISAVSAEGTVCLYTGVAGTDLIVDVAGYLAPDVAPVPV